MTSRVAGWNHERCREYSEDIILDFDDQGNLLGIEVLDPEADLSTLVGELGLDPHILDIMAKIRQLIVEAHEQLLLA